MGSEPLMTFMQARVKIRHVSCDILKVTVNLLTIPDKVKVREISEIKLKSKQIQPIFQLNAWHVITHQRCQNNFVNFSASF